MTTETLHIRNMVCPRCIEAVVNILKEQNLNAIEVQLGQAIIAAPLDNKGAIAAALKQRGFELIQDKNEQLVGQIKSLVIDLIYYKAEQPHLKNSVYLSDKLSKPYTQLSKMFSTQEGITIEKYIIAQKIEKVKELLSYEEKTLSEIAFEIGYSSVQHLSTQFKTVTGYSVTQYKGLKDKNRKGLDSF